MVKWARRIGTMALLLTLSACSSPGGGAQPEQLYFSKAGVQDRELVSDLRVVVATAGVLSVVEHWDDQATYLRIWTYPRAVLNVREKISALGWKRIGGLPTPCTEGLYVQGRQPSPAE
ncbi:MAG TPA: hypothetical protein VKU80_00495 [Planctomycetota bacterium]|nr:hypothetical protein [Planctomycetota bacterium]